MSNAADMRVVSNYFLRLSLSFCSYEQTDTGTSARGGSLQRRLNDNHCTAKLSEKGKSLRECRTRETVREGRVKITADGCFYSSPNWLAPRLIPHSNFASDDDDCSPEDDSHCDARNGESVQCSRWTRLINWLDWWTELMGRGTQVPSKGVFLLRLLLFQFYCILQGRKNNGSSVMMRFVEDCWQWC